jgi:acyl carrier protein
MSETDTFSRVQDVIRDCLDKPDLVLTPQMVARDVEGWDSIAMVNIILQTQKVFGIRFKSTEIDELVNVGDFVTKIEAKTAR